MSNDELKAFRSELLSGKSQAMLLSIINELLERRFTPISKDRYYPSEANCDRRGFILGFDGGVWVFMTPGQFREGNYTYWLKPLPAPPEPKPDWEVAWQDWNKEGRTNSNEYAFRSGYLAAQAQKGTK